MWGGGFGFRVKFGLLSQRGFWLVRSYILASGFVDVLSSGTQTFLTDSRHGNLNFRRVIYFRFRSGFCFRSHFYILAAELRPPRVRDLRTMEEVGSTRLTSLERVTTGVGSVSRAVLWEADSHGRLLRTTLTDDVVPKIRYLLDSESTQITDKIYDFTVTPILRPKRGRISWKMRTTPSPNQSSNRKLMRSQTNVHIPLPQMQAATILSTITTNERNKTT